MHSQPRSRNSGHVHEPGAEDVIPSYRAVLRHVVVNGAKAGQVLGHETAFAAKRIAGKQTVSTFERLIKTNGALIGDVVLVTHIEIVVAVRAAADYLRNSIHRHTASIHAHRQIRPRNVFE